MPLLEAAGPVPGAVGLITQQAELAKTGPWHKVSDELFNRSNTKEKVCVWQSLQEALLQCWSVLIARSAQAHPKCCISNEHACKVLRIQGEECQSAPYYTTLYSYPARIFPVNQL